MLIKTPLSQQFVGLEITLQCAQENALLSPALIYSLL